MSATSSAAAPFPVSFQSLILNAVGEYTARSVAADPLDAKAMRLVKQPDGDYAPAAPDRTAFTVSGVTAARSASPVQWALYGLSLGG